MESTNTNSMSVVHTVQRRSHMDSAHPDTNRVDAQLGHKLLVNVTESLSESELTAAIVATIRASLDLDTIAYLQRRPNNAFQWYEAESLSESLPPGSIEQLIKWANEAAEQKQTQIKTINGAYEWIVICEPVIVCDRAPEVLIAAARAGTRSVDLIASATQLCSSHATIWHCRDAVRQANIESSNSIALLELAGKLDECENLTRAGYCFVNETREFLDCQRVVVGLSAQNRAACRLLAISGLSGFDKRNELTRTIESALNETMLRKCVTTISYRDADPPEGTLALKKLLQTVDAKSLISSPLLSDSGDIVGAWLLIDAKAIDAEKTIDFVRCSQTSIGNKLHAIRTANTSRLTRCCKAISRPIRSRRFMAAMASLMILIGVMCIPMNYRIACDCQLEPVSRRFVAAPYDGTLKEALVEAGDVVKAGQVLAKMDARELRWELAGMEAEYKSTQKERDAASARDEVAEAQQSNLQMQRLELKMQLINHRLANLEVKSPIDGVVIAGDMKKSEGAPLTIGQTVFEIGPLDQMIVEVAVPERDVLHVKTGMDVHLRLDAAMQTTESGKIARISPRAETRNAESVFVAEVYLPNRNGRLRPGMKGTAKVASQPHSLGWILFHKSWESLAMKFGW